MTNQTDVEPDSSAAALGSAARGQVPTAAAPRPIRTAVVIVHGMGEQMPVETLNRFVLTALPEVDGTRLYYSRPARITDSYEARRLLAWRQRNKKQQLVHGQTEFFEYHWSYMMTGNKLRDIVPTFLRLLFRSPRSVPRGLQVIWFVLWLIIVALIFAIVVAVARGALDDYSLVGVVTVLAGGGFLATAILWALSRVGDAVTKSFVDVIRYLDRSPRSYAVRRSIRQGMVELLKSLHEKDRYARVIVVAHSLGAYIAYDAITALWPEMYKLHCGPITTGRGKDLAGLNELEAAAAVLTDPTNINTQQQSEILTFQDRQFELWKGLRAQGNPWLITDFVSFGAPMYFADLLYTHKNTEFLKLVQRTEVPTCPPRDVNESVEGEQPWPPRYGWNNRGRTVLGGAAPFAVVRWTNMYFPADYRFFGDWFGGPLRKLYGQGIRDVAITGNLQGRRWPAVAHTRYFNYPDDTGEHDVANLLRTTLNLAASPTLPNLSNVPPYLEETQRTP